MLSRKSTSEQNVLFSKRELLFQRGKRMAQDGFRRIKNKIPTTSVLLRMRFRFAEEHLIIPILSDT